MLCNIRYHIKETFAFLSRHWKEKLNIELPSLNVRESFYGQLFD